MREGDAMNDFARSALCFLAIATMSIAVLASLACQGQQKEMTETPARSAGPPGPPGPASSEAVPQTRPLEAMIEISKSALATTDDPFTIKGSGFQPGEPVVLQLRVHRDWSIVLGGAGGAQVLADMAGNFTITFDRIAIEPIISVRRIEGERSLVAMGSDGSRASVPVKIVDEQNQISALSVEGLGTDSRLEQTGP